jgi:HAE1 family hydrophobic/amphiphilic exporter-1
MRRPVTLVMMLASVVILGLIAFSKVPLAFLPHVEFPGIFVYAPYAGGIPSETEREITRPLEEVLATLGGVHEIESESSEDEAWVWVEFDWGRDPNVLRLEVQEKIDQIRGQLPADLRDVFLFTFNSNDIPIMEGRISAKGRDLSESYDLIEQKIVRPLQRIPGVGRVLINGVNPTIGAIYLRLDRVKEFGVDVGRLFQELEAANVSLTMGTVTDQGLRYDLRAVSGIESMDELGKIPIDDRGLRLADVAELVYAAPAPSFGRHLNGEFAIAFDIQKASGYNTVAVCRDVSRTLEEINRDPALQGINTFTFFNQAEQITHSLNGLWKAGLFGSILAVTILYVFLRKMSLTLLVALSIPVSILGTGIFLYFTGNSLNVLTMMGLMLGIGMLVDNAVVVLESINRRRNLGASPAAAALRGTRDVARAIVASTLTTVIVFAPIIVTAADELAVWLGQVGITIAVTIICSLLVSLTVIPGLSVFLVRADSHESEARWVGAVRRAYERVLRWTVVRHPKVTGLAIVPGILALTIALFFIPGAFDADFMGDEGVRHERLSLSFDYSGPVDKKTSERYVDVVEEYLETRREELGIRDLYSYYGPDEAGVSLFFERGVLSDEFLAEMRDDLREHLPVQAGVEYRFGDEEGQETGVESFSVTLFGDDTELLTEIAAETERRLASLDGVTDVMNEADRGHPEIRVAVDPERAARHGIRARTVSQILGLTYRGTNLPRLNTGKKEIDLQISLLPEDRESIENLATTTVAVEDGAPVHLNQIADFEFTRSPGSIRRQNRKTGVSVTGSYEGDDFDAALKRIETFMNEQEMPLGYGWNFGSRIREAQERKSEMGTNLLLALFCVFFVMASLFESLSHPLVVMGCVVFAIIGPVWLFLLTGTPINLMAFIGAVILIGIVVNNGIVLVDHVNHYRRTGLPVDKAILLGGGERLRPILMTAGTTVLGLLPLAVFQDAHVGDAKYYPMARAIIGGLLSSTVLTLVVMPTYYRLVDGWKNDYRAVWAGVRARGRRPRTARTPAGAA